METEGRKKYYYEKRNVYNGIKIGDSIDIEKAALFIFLNKTCFNGLYRVNKSGLYNVPMGAYKNPCICDKENLLNVSRALENVIINCWNYLETEKIIDENTFVYVDPPYRPLPSSSSFTSYTNSPFGDKEQVELADFATRVKEKNARIILSNSDPKNVDVNDNFFDELYRNFIIKRVSATRMISSNSGSRGRINELLIRNFEEPPAGLENG